MISTVVIRIFAPEFYNEDRKEIYYMPAKTQDLEKFLQIAENLYEAAMVISKRARQINEDMYQKKRDRQILEELEGGLEEEFLQPEPEETEVEEVPEDENPVVNAQYEFVDGQLEFHYEPVRR